MPPCQKDQNLSPDRGLLLGCEFLGGNRRIQPMRPWAASAYLTHQTPAPDHDGLILGERRDGKQADPGEHDRNDLTCSKEMKRDRAVGAQGSGK